MIVWLCGPAGSGKTTLGRLLPGVLLDGDEVYDWLTPDCQLNRVGRLQQAERMWRVASLLPKAVVAFTLPPPRAVDLLVLLRVKEWLGCTPDLVLDTTRSIEDCLSDIERRSRD